MVGWAAAPSGADHDARSNRARARIAKIAALLGSQEPDLPWRFVTLDQIKDDTTPLVAKRARGFGFNYQVLVFTDSRETVSGI